MVDVKISDFLKMHKLAQEGVSEEQVRDCVSHPELSGPAFDNKREVCAKQIGEKVLICVIKNGLVETVIFTKLTNDLSHYDNAEHLYDVAFSATAKESFIRSDDGMEAMVSIDRTEEPQE